MNQCYQEQASGLCYIAKILFKSFFFFFCACGGNKWCYQAQDNISVGRYCSSILLSTLPSKVQSVDDACSARVVPKLSCQIILDSPTLKPVPCCQNAYRSINTLGQTAVHGLTGTQALKYFPFTSRGQENKIRSK